MTWSRITSWGRETWFWETFSRCNQQYMPSALLWNVRVGESRKDDAVINWDEEDYARTSLEDGGNQPLIRRMLSWIYLLILSWRWQEGNGYMRLDTGRKSVLEMDVGNCQHLDGTNTPSTRWKCCWWMWVEERRSPDWLRGGESTSQLLASIEHQSERTQRVNKVSGKLGEYVSISARPILSPTLIFLSYFHSTSLRFILSWIKRLSLKVCEPG